MKRINSIISPSLINSSSTTKCVNSGRTFRSNPKGFATEVKIDFNAPPKAPKADAKWEEMTFALTSTDYMYTAGANKGEEFTPGKIVPYGPIALYPSATVLNYGQGSFEGIKAFRTTKDNIVVFRPDQNAKRMNAGAVDFCMSTVPERIYLEAIEQVVKANSHWVPPVNKGALYLRPILFGDGAQLGVAPSNHYAFIVWASPVGSYFKAGKITPINLLVSPGQHRAAPIGSGHVKAIGNYAPVFKVQKYAKDNGYTEVLFLDARNDKYVEEAGASNFFCLTKDGVLRTPELGAILPGVTRMSLMQLAKDMGIKISEERLSIETVLESKEVFCSGTGASVTPVGSVTYKGNKVVFNNGEVGPLSQALYNGLLDIQLERTADKYNWLFRPWK